MSNPVLTLAWNQRKLLSSQKLLLVALADYASDDGRCWPGTDALSARTCMSRPTITRSLKELQAKGLLIIGKKIYRRANGEQGWQNSYQLRLDQFDATPRGFDQNDETGVGSNEQGGLIKTEGGFDHFEGGVDHSEPQTLNRTIKNPY
jgi:hypothetical protein